MFFAKLGIYKACGLYNYKHFLSIILIGIILYISIKKTKINNKNDITKIIHNLWYINCIYQI